MLILPVFLRILSRLCKALIPQTTIYSIFKGFKLPRLKLNTDCQKVMIFVNADNIKLLLP